MENHDDIEEQIEKLQRICDNAHKLYKFYDDEFEAETEEGFVIHQDLIDKLDLARKEFNTALDKYNTLHRFCSKNNIVLTKHWIRLGFTKSQIESFVRKL